MRRLKASAVRIQKDLEYLATCTDGVGSGTTRLAFSDEENKARMYLKDQMLQAGLQIRIDAAGNVIGLLVGREPSLPTVMTGSHMDSIYNGGNFDGIAGVVAGIEVARIFRDQRIKPRRSIEIVGFTGEENSRFYPGQFGSRAIAGMIRSEELYSVRGTDGVLLADAMQASGFDPNRIHEAAYSPGSLYRYFELHIEQCSVLERNNMEVGVVNCISGAAHHRVTIHGPTDHAGGTPMYMRSDAMAAAAEYVLEAERLAKEIGYDTVATVGNLQVFPNIPNVIPGKVELNADIRSSKMEYNDSVMDGLEHLLKTVCEKRGCTYQAVREHNSEPVPIREDLQQLIADKADQLGISNQRIFSGAGHDSIRIAALCPIAMIFVPSKNGLSHCPEEWTDYDLIAKGTEVLFETMLQTAEDI
ncbi:MAG: Zn-dependent hydrolase [Oscillospiraceae bacterium]|nr:Zn-dependent hydrolase [Oscillospiraceae bacterium]